MTERSARARKSASAAEPASESVAALWLEVQQRVASRAVHEVKNALNGVAVNLEVVRSRLARAGTEVAAVARYAYAGAAQFETLTTLVEALLVLSRPTSGAPDVLALLGPMVALLTAAEKPEGRGIDIAGPSVERGAAMTRASADAVRLALGAALLGALEARRPVRCVVAGDGKGGTIVTIGSDGDDASPSMDARVRDAVSRDGIGVERERGAIRLTFAPPDGAFNS